MFLGKVKVITCIMYTNASFNLIIKKATHFFRSKNNGVETHVNSEIYSQFS